MSLINGNLTENVLRIPMTFLSEKEIVEGLKKIGIQGGSELDSFLRDYKEYCIDTGILEVRRSHLNRNPLHRTISRRVNKAWLSAVAFLCTALSVPKANVHNQGKQ